MKSFGHVQCLGVLYPPGTQGTRYKKVQIRI